MRHSNRIIVHVTFDVGPELGQRQAADDGLVRFWRTVTPPVVTVESAAKSVSHGHKKDVSVAIKLTQQSTFRLSVVQWSQLHHFSSSQKICRLAGGEFLQQPA